MTQVSGSASPASVAARLLALEQKIKAGTATELEELVARLYKLTVWGTITGTAPAEGSIESARVLGTYDVPEASLHRAVFGVDGGSPTANQWCFGLGNSLFERIFGIVDYVSDYLGEYPLTAEINGINERHQALLEDIGTFPGGPLTLVESINERLAQMQETIDTFQITLSSHGSSINSHTSSLNSHTSSISSLNSRVSALEN